MYYVVGRMMDGRCEWYRGDSNWLPNIHRAKVYTSKASANSVVYHSHCGKVVSIHPDNVEEGRMVKT
jgi:hypothetical protein